MKNNYFRTLFFIFSFFLFAFTSCKNFLIENTDTGEITAVSKKITAPSAINVSQGDYRNITLSWDAVPNAKQYFIYASINPFENFTKVGETSEGITEFNYSVKSGKTVWFRISSYSYKGIESSLSKYTSGSSVAIPNITNISLSANGTSSTVNWWMNNCNQNTYENAVTYKVTCYEENKTSIVDSKIVSGSVNTAEICGLKKKSHYYYQVEAYIDSYKSEVSDFTDIETARLTSPYSVDNLTIDQGINTKASGKGIQISWQLPEGVEYKVSSNNTDSIYEVHPLYFSIERKLADEADESYTTLVNYIGTVNSAIDSSEGIYFTCGTSPTSSSSLLEVDCSQISSIEENEISNYSAYVIGSKLTYTDLNVEDNKLYTYRVRSYSDDVGQKTISSDTSVDSKNGWLISTPALNVEPDYKKESEESQYFSSISAIFNLDFEDYNLDNTSFYKYILTYQRTPFPTESETNPQADEEKFLISLNSVEQINNFVKIYDSDFLNKSENQGYYSYSLYICNSNVADDSIPDEYYSMTQTPTNFSLTNDASKIPEIKTFTVNDGYASKYILTWDYNENYEYSLLWATYNGGTEQITGQYESCILNSSDLNIDNGMATYVHSVTSGDARKYTLIANNGLQVSKEAEGISKTLGTANVQQGIPSYDSITVHWKEVQKATVYNVKAYYASDSSQNDIAITDGENPNTTLTTEDGIVTCTITKPKGYNSALKSGSEIKLEVTASNENTEDNSTTCISSVCTFGPALINATVGKLQENNISIIWNTVQNAAGYIIYRVLYSDNTADNTKLQTTTDKYYYDVTLGTLKRNDDTPTEGSAVTSKKSQYYLNDIDDSNCKSESSLNQRKIASGLPFGYIILPILGDGDDFNFEQLEIKDGNAGITYADITESSAFIKNASLGYGLNVKASKSESSVTINVSWDRPYENETGIPYIYRCAYGDEDNWERIDSLGVNVTEFNDPLSGKDKTIPYRYAVQYHSSSSKLDYKAAYKKHLEQLDKRYSDIEDDYEELNKGYLLYFDFSASYNGTLDSDGKYVKDSNYYSEKLSHTLWNFDERKRGPALFTLYAYNQNTSMGYVKLADIAVDSSTGEETFTLNAENGILKDDTSSDTKIEKSGSDLILSPIGLTAGSANYTDGVLKVLRSAKTYYKLSSSLPYTRDNKEGTAEFSDSSVYAYRQISNEELTKAAMLVLAYGFYKDGDGKDDLSNIESKLSYNGDVTLTTANGGTATFGSRLLCGISEAGKYKANVSMNKYAPEQLLPTGDTETLFCISMTNVSTRTDGLADSYLNKFRTEGFTVTVNNVVSELSGMDSYSGTLTVTCTDSSTLKIIKDGTTMVDTTDKEVRRKWFPIQISDDHCWIKSTTYGWWPAE